MATSPFAGAIQFLDELGIYDVVLPFLLVFTVVFAILEKSRIFGTETIDGIEYTKKNLNSMFAFVTSFLVIASTRLVAAINEAIANMVLVLLLSVCFLLLAGTFHTGKDEFELKGAYKAIFLVIMFVSVMFIFLHALKTKDGKPWLFVAWDFISAQIDSSAFGALVLTGVLVLLMLYITENPFSGTKGKSSED